MGQFGLKKISPMTELQAAIGAGAMLAFFVLWLLIVKVGDDFVNWVGGKSNLSGWVQAIGSIAAVGVAVWVPYKIEINRIADKKIDDYRIAVINFGYVSGKLNSLMSEIVDISEAIKESDSLESHSSILLELYIQAFFLRPLPELRELESLRYISFLDTRKLVIILRFLNEIKLSLLSAQNQAKILSDGATLETRFHFRVLARISESSGGYKEILDEVISNFDNEIKLNKK